MQVMESETLHSFVIHAQSLMYEIVWCMLWR